MQSEDFTDVLAGNDDYAAHFALAGLEPVAARGLAVVTCMDSRIEPLDMLGLKPGDAKIMRNAGARVTTDVLRTLADRGDDRHHRLVLAERGDDGEHQHLRYIKQINAAIAGRPADMKITTHMCRGNFRSSWAAEGGYDFVAEALFGELDVDGFFCEFDDERSGGFAPLRFVPPGKQVVLGLVTTKTGKLEDADDLKRRIDEAAKYVPLEQLCLSPQCGFSSTVEGNVITQEEQVAKLRLIVQVAQDVWG